MNSKESTIIYIGNKSYCAFCGHEITPSTEGQRICYCEDAKQYRQALRLKLQLEIEAAKVMRNAPKPKYGLQTVIAPISDIEASGEEEDIPSPQM